VILRDYQIRVLDETWDALQRKLNVLITAPCSAGKTILFSKIIQRLLRENPAFRALILVDREILVTQSADKLRTVAPELALSIGIICASVTAEKRTDKAVTVASRQSLVNRLDVFPPVQLVIIDEAHLMAIPHDDALLPDQYSQIISRLRGYNQNMRMLGCTASPYRLGTKGGYIYGDRNRCDAHPYFDAVDSEISTKALLTGGYIAPLVGRVRMDESMADDLANVKMVAGEFNIGQLSDVMLKSVHIRSCIDAWKQYANDRKKTLAFCATIEHAEAVAAAFNDDGIGAMAIHSKLPAIVLNDRMDALQHGRSKVFTSVAKLTTGMDVVDIDCLIMARPTKSTALYQQCLGRGQRLAEGKTDCLVIDLVGCTKEFGTDMDNLRVAIPSSSTGDGEAPEKVCPGDNLDGTVCGQRVHASLKYCPHCGYEFPTTEAVEAAVGTLKKVEFNTPAAPVPYDVQDVQYQIHESQKSGKMLIKIIYDCGYYSQFNEYLCLPDFYSGFAVEKARGWWADRSDEPFPATVDEFMFLSGSLSEPAQIMVVKDGRFDRIVESKFEQDEDSEDVFTTYKPYSEMTAEEMNKLSEEIPF